MCRVRLVIGVEDKTVRVMFPLVEVMSPPLISMKSLVLALAIPPAHSSAKATTLTKAAQRFANLSTPVPLFNRMTSIAIR
jgi:hypothetical protein